MQWVTDLDLGKAQLAADLARKAIGVSPSSPGSWLALGRALIALGEFQQATACLREASEVVTASVDVQLLLAEALANEGLFEQALFHAEAALAISPDHERAKTWYFDLRASTAKWDENAVDANTATAVSRSSARALNRRSRSLGPRGTLSLCDVLLAEDPAHTNAKYLKAIALAALGRSEEAKRLLALDGVVAVQAVPCPPGYATGDAFREALEREIRTNPTLTRDPRSKATRDGLQTRRLRQPGALAIEALLDQIQRAVDDYERRLHLSRDDFAVTRPWRVRLQAWAVIYGGAGRQAAHRHPAGWLSGVYYVAAPRPRGEHAFRGRLIVGAVAPEDYAGVPPWGTREIEPIPGRLVLFPSYVPHATEPSGVDGGRISVAFDVVPVRENR